jgi:small nuclear ribonucleoprotein D3
MATIGVPIKLVHESIGYTVTVELTTGALYRGTLLDAEDSLNLQLNQVLSTDPNGHQTQLEHVYVRGSHIRWIQVPDMLAQSPMFKNGNIGPGGISRGRGLGMAGRGRGGNNLNMSLCLFNCVGRGGGGGRGARQQ